MSQFCSVEVQQSASATLAADGPTTGTLLGKLLLVSTNAINSQHSLGRSSEKLLV